LLLSFFLPVQKVQPTAVKELQYLIAFVPCNMTRFVAVTVTRMVIPARPNVQALKAGPQANANKMIIFLNFYFL
jgi:hypothetical protein